MKQTSIHALAVLLVACTLCKHIDAFTVRPTAAGVSAASAKEAGFAAYKSSAMFATSDPEEKKPISVIELDDVAPNGVKEPRKQIAPFLSQGEILPETLNPDLSDPKQTRVIIYVIISLLPVLFLIPLMLASRDLIPAEMLPPVQM
jgi:hypothetical protein